MNYADIKYPDIQDGEGIRVGLYVSGCHFHCVECHNKESWDFNYGKEFTDETIDYIMNILKESYVNGLSLLGGEPLELVNQKGLLPLVKRVKEELPEKDIWCWTGYDFEKDVLGKMYKTNEVSKELLQYIDIIVDGQFEIENKIKDLKFRGSINQRKIDVQKSLQNGKLVKLKFGDESRYEDKKPKIMYFGEFKKSNNNLTKENENNKIPVNFEVIKSFENASEQPNTIVEQEIKETIAAKNVD